MHPGRRFPGLSPRGRGKRAPAEPSCNTGWSIPAWAGETIPAIGLNIKARVYPRVGGGNRPSSPFTNGKGGLSPRGRGKRLAFPSNTTRPGSIPAWAGETAGRPAVSELAKVYPRVGGGNLLRRRLLGSNGGLSPRGRGKPSQQWADGGCPGSIPAWAGETRHISAYQGKQEVYPRVGGGNRYAGRPCPFLAGLSPRGRGKQGKRRRPCRPSGSIPAWAGETPGLPAGRAVRMVYPRVGGGNC